MRKRGGRIESSGRQKCRGNFTMLARVATIDHGGQKRSSVEPDFSTITDEQLSREIATAAYRMVFLEDDLIRFILTTFLLAVLSDIRTFCAHFLGNAICFTNT